MSSENAAPIHEAASEEAALLERSSAPTLRDLRGAAKDLSANVEAEPESALSNDGPPRQAA